MILVDILEGIGAVIGVISATLIASNTTYTKWGFVGFFLSNGVLMGWAFLAGAWYLFYMNCVFQVVNTLAIKRWFFPKKGLTTAQNSV
jgi:hypothetical protein